MDKLNKYLFGILLAAGLTFAADNTAKSSYPSSAAIQSSAPSTQTSVAKVKIIKPTGTKTNWSKIKDLFM